MPGLTGITLQELEVTGGCQFLDGIRRQRSLSTDGRDTGVSERVPIGGVPDPTAIQQTGERLGPGATTQIVGRDDASIGAARGSTQPQGLGGGQLGQGFLGGS